MWFYQSPNTNFANTKIKEHFIKWTKYQVLAYIQIHIVMEEVGIEFGTLNPLGQWDKTVPPTIYTNFKFSIHIY